MRLLLRVVLLIVVAVAMGEVGPPVVARAKGPVDRIVISRVGWPAPVEVTSGEMLDLLSPWRDDLLGTRLSGQPNDPGASLDYGSQVWFYLEAEGGQLPVLDGLRPDPDGMRLIYYVEYYPDLSGATAGFLLLHDDPRTENLNTSTIIRATGWYEATPAWQQLMASLPGSVVPPQTGDGGLAR
jgi:hypothetical protein